MRISSRLQLFLPGAAMLFALLLGTSGCSDGESPMESSESQEQIQLTISDNGRELKLRSGQIVSITLDSNPGTGYQWEIVERDEKYMHLVGENEFKSAVDSQMPGAGGTQTFSLNAKAAGHTAVKIVYRRSWEKDALPEKSFYIDAHISP